MHMADALLSPAVGGTFWAGTLAAIGYASRKLKETVDDKMIPLMGVLGAFIFAAQMINFTIPGTGSSGHIGGGMILTIILGPWAAFLTIASVLTVQGLFFADGGLLALGCNIWNMGIYPCFIVYPLLYRPLAGDGRNARRLLIASVASVVVCLQLGAFSVVIETLLSGKSELPFGTFVLLMQPIHLAIGAVEGFVTAAVVRYVQSMRPELLETAASSRSLGQGISMKKVLIAFAVAAIVTGGILSWFASTHPDGLEWSIEKMTGKSELPGQEQGVAKTIEDIQNKTVLMPDYNFRSAEGEKTAGKDSASWPSVDTGTSLAGLMGAAVVLFVIVVLGFGIRAFRKKRESTNRFLTL